MNIPSMNIQSNLNVKEVASNAQNKGAELENSGNSMANEMKDIRKARLQRQVMADPSLAGKLVATEASPTYNAKGAVIQALSSSLGDV